MPFYTTAVSGTHIQANALPYTTAVSGTDIQGNVLYYSSIRNIYSR